jgi:hypothetical protein
MNYTTNLDGFLMLSPYLNQEQINTINELGHGDGHLSPDSRCQWVVSSHGDVLEWDFRPKFYNYIEWLNFINEIYLKQWGVKMNGIMHWCGTDSGMIAVANNKINIINM